MPSQDTKTAIVFADVTGTTSLVEQLGDARAHALVKRALDSLTELTTQFGGRTVRRLGDELLCAFSDAASALLFALAAHRHPGLDTEGRALGLRIGVHWGTVVSGETGDVFGDGVKVGSRLCALALPGQVITTKETLDAVPRGVKVPSRRLGEHVLPGRARPLDLVEVLSPQLTGDAITQMLRAPESGTAERPLVLRLMFHGTALELRNHGAGEGIGIGRDDENLVVVPADWVSRSHATVEARNGKFYLVDHSTNGTWVATNGGRAVVVKRETVVLLGRGTISPGCEPADAGEDTLRYEIS